MTKRIVLCLAVVAVAFLCSTAAFAGENPAPVKETFLANLQEPAAPPAEVAQPNVGNVPQPLFMALPSCTSTCKCTYQCNKCTATSVKLCAVNCVGATGCEPCHSGTTCSI